MKPLALAAIALASVASLVAVTSASATTVIYNNFTSTAGLTLVGNAGTAVTSDGTVLQLTAAAGSQSGAAYSTTAITLGSNATFSSTFQFRFTNPGGIDPADGITLVLAASPTGLGTGGGDLGYGGVPNSVAIEFDTFANGGADTNSNHVAVDTGGLINDLSLASPYGVTNCVGSSPGAGCFSDGDLWSATIGYNGSVLTVQVQDGSMAPQTVINQYAINIGSALGTNTAYVGFTGGTGSGFENQDVVNWAFSNTTALAGGGGVPEPGVWEMMLLGFGSLGAVLRRRRALVS